MTIILPNPFIDSLSADRIPPAGHLTAHVDHAAVLSIRETPHGACQEVETVAASEQADAAVTTSEEFFPYRFGRKPRAPKLSADVVRKLEIALAEIVAFVDGTPAPLFLLDPSPEYLAASSNHMALRSLASNSNNSFSKA